MRVGGGGEVGGDLTWEVRENRAFTEQNKTNPFSLFFFFLRFLAQGCSFLTSMMCSLEFTS